VVEELEKCEHCGILAWGLAPTFFEELMKTLGESLVARGVEEAPGSRVVGKSVVGGRRIAGPFSRRG